MTSIHFVVHPLPGTEDQLNDRYLLRAGKIGFKSKIMHTGCDTLDVLCFRPQKQPIVYGPHTHFSFFVLWPASCPDYLDVTSKPMLAVWLDS